MSGRFFKGLAVALLLALFSLSQIACVSARQSQKEPCAVADAHAARIISAVIAPYHVSAAHTYDEVMEMYRGDGIGGFIRKADDVAKALGIGKYVVQGNIGGYSGLLEPSFTFDFEMPDSDSFSMFLKKVELFASIVGDIGCEIQDAVIVYFDDDAQQGGTDSFYTTQIPLSDVSRAVACSNAMGLSDFTVRIGDKVLFMLFFDDYLDEESLAGMNGRIQGIVDYFKTFGAYDGSRKIENRVRKSLYVDIAQRSLIYDRWQSAFATGAGLVEMSDPNQVAEFVRQAQEVIARYEAPMRAAV